MIISRSCIYDAPVRARTAGAFAVIARGIKRSVFALAALTVLIFCFTVPASETVYASDDSYTTDVFDVDIDITEKHVMKYDERITVDFLSPHHGIYRYIPVQKKFYDVRDILVDGGECRSEYRFSGENENGTYGNQVLQIGDAYRTFTGQKEYRIRYSLVCTKDEDRNKDYLSLDLLPTGWQTPIEKAAITVKLPEKVEWDEVSLYTGKAGSRSDIVSDRDHFSISYSKDGRTLTVDARDLPQGSGVTLQAELPEGYWKGVTSRKWLGIFAVILPALMAMFMALLWRLCGKDPDIIKPVEFYPPDEITPAEVGYIVDGRVDNKDLSSMLIYFASKGYMDIRETGSNKYELVKKCDIPDSEPTFAVRLFGGLFPYEEAVEGQEQTADLDDLPSGFGDAVRVARDELMGMYDNGKKKMFTGRSRSARGIGRLICALILPAAVLITAYSNYRSFGLFGAGIPFVLVLIGIALISSSYDNRHSTGRVSSAGKFIAGLIVSAIAGFTAVVLIKASGGSFAVGIAALICLAAAIFFEVFMWARTKENAAVYGKILGFRNFIATAEHQRLVALSDENPEYYYNIMPYAMVMGMSVAWAKKFENMKVPEPDWYQGEDFGRLNTAVWYNNMANTCSSQFVSASSMMPDIADAVDSGGFFTGGDFSGGGFGGGGFSGGGFGGGGGGAW